MGTTWGYVQVLTEDLLQLAALRTAGVPEANIIQEEASREGGRPLYNALLALLCDGDSLVVSKVDRLGVSTLDALQTAKDLDTRGVRVIITTLGIDLKTPSGRCVLDMMIHIAEFERELIRDRAPTRIAKSFKLGPAQRAEAIKLHGEEGKSIDEIAAQFGCARTVVHRAVKLRAARGNKPSSRCF
jgi:putative DNA-invertase from lambdoid prophage Rac